MTKTAERSDTILKDVDSTIDLALLKARRIYISEGVDSGSAADIIRKLWYLELQDPGKPILFVISSPGGSIDAGFAVWDTVQLITSPVSTLITGLAASMGTVLGLCGKKGQRYCTPNARIMIHQPAIHGAVMGQATDLEIQAREITKTRAKLVDLYAEETGQDRDAVEKAIDRDSWMSAQEAHSFGLVDKLVTSFDEVK